MQFVFKIQILFKGLECAVFYKEPLGNSIRVGHSPDFRLPSVAILPWLCRRRREAIFTHCYGQRHDPHNLQSVREVFPFSLFIRLQIRKLRLAYLSFISIRKIKSILIFLMEMKVQIILILRFLTHYITEERQRQTAVTAYSYCCLPSRYIANANSSNCLLEK